MKHLLTLITLLTLGMTVMAQENAETTEQIIHIGPYTQECVGVGPQQCLIVRYEDEDNYTFFYDRIIDFEFEEGFEYTLAVNITERENTPADASSLQYELVELLRKYPATLSGKIWELQSLSGTQIEEPDRYTLLLTEDGASIGADCNTVRANWTRNPFRIETTITTMVACPPDSLETDFLAALNAATIASVENGELILQSTDGQLRFAPPHIDGIEWSLARVLGPAMMLELDGSVPYTLQIDGDRVSAQIACNRGMGSVEMNDAILEFGAIATTRMFCPENPLDGLFPPENAVYSLNADGNLVLETSDGMRYELTRIDAE